MTFPLPNLSVPLCPVVSSHHAGQGHGSEYLSFILTEWNLNLFAILVQEFPTPGVRRQSSLLTIESEYIKTWFPSIPCSLGTGPVIVIFKKERERKRKERGSKAGTTDTPLVTALAAARWGSRGGSCSSASLRTWCLMAVVVSPALQLALSSVPWPSQ